MQKRSCSGSRGTFGGGNGGLFTAGRTSSLSRASASSQGRFSEGGRTQIKDTRPLADKAFLYECTRKIFTFTDSKGYNLTRYTARSLMNPSMKDFFAIFEFLYSHIKVKFMFGAKPEDEIPKIVKQLRYPFIIARSMMLGMGNRHTWGNLVGLLVWMVELVQVLSSDCLPFTSLEIEGDVEFDGISQLELLHEVVTKIFKDYMNEKVDEENDIMLLRQCAESICKKPDPSEIENLQGKCQELKEQENELKRVLNELQFKASKTEEINKDVERLNNYFTNMDEYFAGRKQECAFIQEEINNIEKEMEPDCAKYEEISGILKKQSAESNLIRIALLKKKNSEDALKAKQTEHSRLEKAVVDKEVKLCNLFSHIGKVNKQLNEAHQKTVITLTTLKDEKLLCLMSQQPLQLSIKQDPLQLSKEMNGVLEQRQYLLTLLQDKRSDLEKELVTSQGILEEVQDFWTNAKQSLDNLAAIVDVEKLKSLQVQENFDTRVKDMDEDLQKLKLDTEDKKNRDSTKADVLNNEIKDLEIKLEQVNRRYEQQEEEMQLVLKKMMERIQLHKTEREKEREEYTKHIKETLRELDILEK